MSAATFCPRLIVPATQYPIVSKAKYNNNLSDPHATDQRAFAANTFCQQPANCTPSRLTPAQKYPDRCSSRVVAKLGESMYGTSRGLSLKGALYSVWFETMEDSVRGGVTHIMDLTEHYTIRRHRMLRT